MLPIVLLTIIQHLLKHSIPVLCMHLKQSRLFKQTVLKYYYNVNQCYAIYRMKDYVLKNMCYSVN